MTGLELGLLIAAAFLVIAIVVFEVLRRHRSGSIKLSPPVLLVLRITLGIVFAILGVVGAFLPIMQGWIFFLLAVLVLFPQSKFAVKAVAKAEPRMPRLVSRLRGWGIGIPRE